MEKSSAVDANNERGVGTGCPQNSSGPDFAGGRAEPVPTSNRRPLALDRVTPAQDPTGQPLCLRPMANEPPIVLCLSGHDPTGGAGIQADIETLGRLGAHPVTVVTALTIQDTVDVRRILPQRPEDLLEQARVLVADLPVAAVKIGLLGSPELVTAVAELLSEIGPVPVVLDPILAAGGGRELATTGLIAALREYLLGCTTVLTPNTPEAFRLTGHTEADRAAAALLATGCRNVLLTGGHEAGDQVVNRWYSAAGVKRTAWPRLPGVYHGSGCTLAAAVAAGLARGEPVATAIAEAQRFTHAALSRAHRFGHGQWLPERRFADAPLADHATGVST